MNLTPLAAYLLLFVAVGVGFIFVHLVAGKLIRPSKPDAEKKTIYECGEPTIGSAWIQFDVRIYVVALLFVIFDVEVAFFFPWAEVFGRANAISSIEYQTWKDEQSVQLEKSVPYRLDFDRRSSVRRSVEVDIRPQGVSVSAYLVKSSDAGAVQNALAAAEEPPKDLILAGKTFAPTAARQDITLVASVPAGVSYSLIFRGGSKPTNAMINLSERPMPSAAWYQEYADRILDLAVPASSDPQQRTDLLRYELLAGRTIDGRPLLEPNGKATTWVTREHFLALEALTGRVFDGKPFLDTDGTPRFVTDADLDKMWKSREMSRTKLDRDRTDTDDKVIRMEGPMRQKEIERNRTEARGLSRMALYEVLVFFGVLLVGFAYLWRRGDLAWVRSTAAETQAQVETGRRGIKETASEEVEAEAVVV
jgi:NADH:ubiquinone oxidoreductase subunit 3 (subunit A)